MRLNLCTKGFQSSLEFVVVHKHEHLTFLLDCQELYNNNVSRSETWEKGQASNVKSMISGESFSLVLRSNKPQAKPFRKWVTSEVLPAIRKTGQYQHPKTASIQDPDEEIIKEFLAFKKRSISHVSPPSPDQIPEIRDFRAGTVIIEGIKTLAERTGDQSLMDDMYHLEAILVRAYTEMQEALFAQSRAKGYLTRWINGQETPPAKKPVGQSVPQKNKSAKQLTVKVP